MKGLLASTRATFVFPSDRLHVIVWNKSKNLISCGFFSGNIQIFSYIEKDSKFLSVQTLFAHKSPITCIKWNERYNKMISGDENGKIIVWIEREGKWIPSMINYAHESPVNSIIIASNGELILIVYESGKFLCGDVSGEQKWCRDYDILPKSVDWNPLRKVFFVVSDMDLEYEISMKGDLVELPISKTSEFGPIVEIAYYQNEWMVIAYANGLLYYNGERQIGYRIESMVTSISLSASGNICAVSTVEKSGSCRILFFNRSEGLQSSIRCNSNSIASMSFSKNDMYMAVSSGNSIYCIAVYPKTLSCMCQDTIVYSIDQGNVSNLIFYNIKNSEVHVKSIQYLVGLESTEKYISLMRSDGRNTSLLIVNEIGVPKFSVDIGIASIYLAIFDNMVCCSSNNMIYLWDFINDVSYFHHSIINIHGIRLHKRTLYIINDIGDILFLSIPTFEKVGMVSLNKRIVSFSISNDQSIISAIDSNNLLLFLDIHTGGITSYSGKDFTYGIWSSDSPMLFAALGQKMTYIFESQNIIEPIKSSSIICGFKEFLLYTIDLKEIYDSPFKPPASAFRVHQTKTMVDFSTLLNLERDSLRTEIEELSRKINHTLIWKKLGEYSLKLFDFALAKKSFFESNYQYGVDFVDLIIQNSNENTKIKSAFIKWYNKEYSEAELIFRQYNRYDLIKSMYSSAGVWEKVLEYSENNERDMVHYALGLGAYSQGKWKIAAEYFKHSNHFKEELSSLVRSDDFIGIQNLVGRLNKGDAQLLEIGMIFLSLGSSEKAVSAFLKYGSEEYAIESLTIMNKWKMAIRLSKRISRDVYKKVILKYANYLSDHCCVYRSIDLFLRSKSYQDAAFSIENEANKAFSTRNYLKAKQLYVFASVLYSKNENCNAARTWDNAIALHFLLLSHRFFYQHMFLEALYPSSNVFRLFRSFINPEIPTALIAISAIFCSYYKQASNAFTFLESSSRLSQKRLKKIEKIAISTFLKNKPIDPPQKYVLKCRKCKTILNEFSLKCKCGEVFPYSISSGKPITNDQIWKCKQCYQYAYISEMENQDFCPLCHQRI